jgi:hypothetical protein
MMCSTTCPWPRHSPIVPAARWLGKSGRNEWTSSVKQVDHAIDLGLLGSRATVYNR